MEPTPDPIEIKTRELCAALVELPSFPELFKKVERYLADLGAQYQLSQLSQLTELLQQRQSMGAEISEEEIGNYEGTRNAIMKSDTIREFVEAQEEIQKIQHQIMRLVTKTFEVGRVPIEDDFYEETCNATCGSHN
jgi:cell fate (sporulation/competence/biofilm development) regulator YlbF (YheA/YmcA/DUF963 family)